MLSGNGAGAEREARAKALRPGLVGGHEGLTWRVRARSQARDFRFRVVLGILGTGGRAEEGTSSLLFWGWGPAAPHSPLSRSPTPDSIL